MIRKRHMRALGGLVLAVGLVAGSGAALAHPGPKHGKPAPQQTGTPGHPGRGHGVNVYGAVTGVGSGTLTVQTPKGTATVNFDSTTHVVKVVAATLADTNKSHVSLHFTKGTTTVDAIRIQTTPNRPTTTTSGTPTSGHKGDKGHEGDEPTVTLTGTPTAPVNHPKPGVIHDGIVTGTTTSSITIQGRGGETATYNLATNVSISKLAAGTTSDLKVGQTISAHGPATGPARDIIILKS